MGPDPSDTPPSTDTGRLALVKGTDPADLDPLRFDVFRTVVDWRSGVIRDAEAIGRERIAGKVGQAWPTPRAAAGRS